MIGEIAMATTAMFLGGDALRGLSRALPLRTTAPGKMIVLYDGSCRFCIAQTKNVVKLARPGALELVSFQEPGVLDRFPGVTMEACLKQMHMVTADGRVYGGLESAIQAVSTRWLLWPFARLYYVPGLRALGDGLYALIAANRYRIMGKAIAAGECDDNGCKVHFEKQKG